MQYDILIRGGTVVDPSQGLHAERDVLVSDGRIQAINDSHTAVEARHVIDARGLFVVPGLIDSHLHLIQGGLSLGQLDLLSLIHI